MENTKQNKDNPKEAKKTQSVLYYCYYIFNYSWTIQITFKDYMHISIFWFSPKGEIQFLNQIKFQNTSCSSQFVH